MGCDASCQLAILGLHCIAGLQKQPQPAGKPRGQWKQWTVDAFSKQYNTGCLTDRPTHSTELGVFKCDCKGVKHFKKVQCHTISNSGGKVTCRVCTGLSSSRSSYAEEVYAMLDDMEEVKAWAAESHAVAGQITVWGVNHLVQHKGYDIELLDPPGYLIEIQGEQHRNKLSTMPNSTDVSISHRVALDAAYARAAQHAKYTMILLCLEEGEDTAARCDRWESLIREAIEH